MGQVAYELGFREWVVCSHSEIGEIAFPMETSSAKG